MFSRSSEGMLYEEGKALRKCKLLKIRVSKQRKKVKNKLQKKEAKIKFFSQAKGTKYA